MKKNTDCSAHNPELVDEIFKKMPKNEHLNDVSNFFKVMSDLTRIRILWALELSNMCVCDLSVVLDMTKSAISHQLKILKEAKLVKSEKIGKHVFYGLDDEHIKTVLEMAMEHIEE